MVKLQFLELRNCWINCQRSWMNSTIAGCALYRSINSFTAVLALATTPLGYQMSLGFLDCDTNSERQGIVSGHLRRQPR